MSSATNIPLNSRTLSGIILISDGVATLSEGDLTCDDITSSSLGTGNITTNNLTCNGELRTNTNGPYSIPVSATSTTGSLISYGNVSNSGATDFTNYGSTYNLLKQGFYFNNINSTTVLTNLAIIDNTQTYFKSPLTGCTAETPLNTTSVVNKTYVDSNFLDRTNNLTQNINGLKTFTNGITINAQSTFNNSCPICNVNPTLGTHLVRRDYVENNFVDKTSNQIITGVKTFDGTTSYNGTALFCNCPGEFANLVNLRNFTRVYDVISPFTNYTQLYTNGNNFFIYPVSVNSGIHFYCRNAVNTEVQTFISSATANTSYVPFVALSTSTFNNLVHLKSTTRMYDLISPFTNYTSFYTSGNASVIYAGFAGSSIQFYCRTAGNTDVQTFYSFATANTSIVPFIASSTATFNSSLISNNITSPTATATNNIYTNLVSGGIINIGSPASSCIFDSIPTFNSDTTFVGNIFSETAVYFKDIGIGSQLNQARIFKQDDYLFFDTNINYTNGYSFRTSSNDTLTITGAETTINNELTSNAQARFNNICPISNITATLTNHLTTLGFNNGKYIDFTTDQIISGTKRFGTIFTGDHSWRDVVSPFTNRVQSYVSGTSLEFVPQFANNVYNFYCKDSVPTQTNPLRINYLNTTISNNLVSNNLTSPTSTTVNNIYTTLVSGGEVNLGSPLSANYIFGETTFNSSSIFNIGCTFLGSLTFFNSGNFSEIEQTSGSNLVLRNITNTRSIILSTKSASTGQVDSLSINTTSCDILSPTLNLTSSSTINILTPNNLTGVINFLSTLTTATINFCSTTYTSIFNLNARLSHKQVQYMNEVKIISGTALTLVFPLEQTWMFTATGGTQITVTLPELTASHQAGFNFFYFKTASVTNSVLFTRSGSNTIRGLNSITDLTSITKISGTNTIGQGFYTAEVSTGNFAWISY